MTSVEIIGTGSYLPGEPVTNERLSSVFGREIFWLSEMLGAQTRHYALDIDTLQLVKGESNAHMATMAARQAIMDADIDPMSIDLIVMATASPDYPFPATALFVQENLRLTERCVIELRAGCAGMAQAFLIATQLIRSGASKRALLIGSELISPFVALFKSNNGVSSDRLVSYAMFGDGAGAVILSAGSGDGGILDCMARSMGGDLEPGMILRVGGAMAPAGLPASENGHSPNVFDHDFKKVILHSPRLIKSARKWFRQELGYKVSDFDLFIPPQANGRLIGIVAAQLRAPAKKIISNFHRVGNTVSASIYIALDQLNKQGALKPGDLLLLLPAEATKWLYGGIIVRWTKGQR
jgi:3-oxoacyl-[acyl-carrier-protein] synthase III